MDKLKILLTGHKTTVILVFVLGILAFLGYFGVKKIVSGPADSPGEIDLIFEAEGPYAFISPRYDGNALVLNLKRTGSYDSISYELAYTSKAEEIKVTGRRIDEDPGNLGEAGAIDRGVQGTVDTKEKKGEYEQEILFGTCSKSVCKYDKGVENGTLVLHIRKGKKAFRMITQWHLQKPDVALGSLTSGDGHLIYKADGDRQTLANIGFAVTSDLTGVPKLPAGKKALGKVYSLNVPVAKELTSGLVSLELAENPPAEAKLFRFAEGKSGWQELDTKIEGSRLSAAADGAGIFAVLVDNI